MDREIVAAELRRHRIDEEGHVVIDDLDDGMGAVPAMLVDARIEDPDLGLAGQTLLAVIPEGEGGAIEVLDLRPHQIVRRHIGVEFADEARRRLGPRAVQPLQGQRHRFLDQLRLKLLRLTGHGPSLLLPNCWARVAQTGDSSN